MVAPASTNTVTRDELLLLQAKAMSEADLLANVINLAHDCGWLVSHSRPAMTTKGWRTATQGDRGALDLTLARGGRVILAELKRQFGGKFEDGQQEWLKASGGYLWQPLDLLTGRIAEVLA